MKCIIKEVGKLCEVKVIDDEELTKYLMEHMDRSSIKDEIICCYNKSAKVKNVCNITGSFILIRLVEDTETCYKCSDNAGDTYYDAGGSYNYKSLKDNQIEELTEFYNKREEIEGDYILHRYSLKVVDKSSLTIGYDFKVSESNNEDALLANSYYISGFYNGNTVTGFSLDKINEIKSEIEAKRKALNIAHYFKTDN